MAPEIFGSRMLLCFVMITGIIAQESNQKCVAFALMEKRNTTPPSGSTSSAKPGLTLSFVPPVSWSLVWRQIYLLRWKNLAVLHKTCQSVENWLPSTSLPVLILPFLYQIIWDSIWPFACEIIQIKLRTFENKLDFVLFPYGLMM